MNLRNLQQIEKGNNAYIICTGGTMLKCKNRVFPIRDPKAFIIGINNMSAICVPDYHLWTNNSRLKQFGKTMWDIPVKMFGKNIKKSVINSVHKGGYFTIDYTDKKDEPISYKNGKIRGHYRTAGCLSIMIAHIMGAENIYIAGMDGYTYIDEENVEGQHFYGEGHTDGTSLSVYQGKDKKVYDALRSIKKYGINFSIITPTVFKEFYNETFHINS